MSDVLSDVLTEARTQPDACHSLARNYGAHMEPMPPQIVHKLSDHFEANRDILECDIPGGIGRARVKPSTFGRAFGHRQVHLGLGARRRRRSSDLVSAKMASGGVSPIDHSAGTHLQVRGVASQIMS